MRVIGRFKKQNCKVTWKSIILVLNTAKIVNIFTEWLLFVSASLQECCRLKKKNLQKFHNKTISPLLVSSMGLVASQVLEYELLFDSFLPCLLFPHNLVSTTSFWNILLFFPHNFITALFLLCKCLSDCILKLEADYNFCWSCWSDALLVLVCTHTHTY